jgi:aldehyde dehydrogenase (NAD+)
MDRNDLYIDGAWRTATSGDVHDAINPASEAVLGRVAQAGPADVEAAIAAARRAFDDGPWPRTSPKERAAALLRMAEAMRRRRDELVDLDVAEVGRPRFIAEAVFVDLPIDHIADMAERVLATFPFVEPMPPAVGPMGMGQGAIHREPFGVAALITPYNAPFFLAAMKLGPALAAGCTTVLKPSPYTPLSAFVMAEIVEEAGLPPGVVNVITGPPEVGERLTTDPRIDLVSFTGSDAVGRSIAAQAAGTLKKVVLELGGKSANIVCDDADLARVVPDVLMNFTINSGQGCSMLTRTLVHRSRHDELVAALKGALDFVNVGDPVDPAVTMGPLISAAQRAKVEGLIQGALDEGAQLVHGGGRPAHLERGFFVEPTVFTGVDNAMTIAQREVFGPVAVIIPFEDDDDAVRIANESDYGLAGGVWANDPGRAYGIAQRVRAGTVFVNGGTPAFTAHAPFGGYKQSGLGREWGRWGLEEFLQTKSVLWPVARG